ncbi:MAG: alpha-L-arabinofuranosidase [Bacteroidaceae bacterium]|nr:alpha-L-arabinofuranosidase [Bacteroidaceae bacterium]
MTSLRTLIAAAAILLATATARANQPDSVYLFAYNADPGSGLSLAYSADGHSWQSIANGASFVKSDFAQWGANKKMYTPELTRDANGLWHLTFSVGAATRQYAHATSVDLIHWRPQDYPMAESLEALKQKFAAIEQRQTEAVVNGRRLKGSVNRVAFSHVEALENAKAAERERSRLNAETLADDATRFARLAQTSVNADIAIDANSAKAISDKLIGIFFEDINYSADGGLYAELLQNRDFEYSAADHGRERNWNATHSWTLEGQGARFTIATEQPLNAVQQHYARLDVEVPGAALVNSGFDGIVVRRGERYDFSLFARQLTGKAARLKVQLLDGERLIGETTVAAPSASWKKASATIVAKADAKSARLAIVPTAAGSLALDFISLFPQKTFKGRKNGMRADLAQTLADLHPRFMRFPGGCLVHGDGLSNMYHWKETIGPLHERKPQRNLWGYHQTRGLGYYEFFQLCEDLGAEPLPVVAAAVPCQNSAIDPVLGGGQQNGIPFGPAFEQYKQDILDLIEWANGDPKTSKWARLRAEAGHPKPFNLKYLGIGNEDIISDTFAVRYVELIEAVKAKHPEITVCGTVGPFFEGSDYERGWQLAKEHDIDMVDEHYYVAPGWYINNQDYYDQYDRTASKVYLGEYASHGPGRKSTIETALTCAMHICSLERNGDVVAMSSYAPLLAKHGHTQWNPDLIYFDNERVFPTVDYQVQRMCGQSQGNTYLPTAATVSLGDDKRRADDATAQRIAVSTVRDSASGRTYVKIVNLLPTTVNATLDAQGIELPPTANLCQLSGTWNATDAKPTVSKSVDLSTRKLALPPYSFTVIEY